MIPYLHLDDFHIGPLPIHPFGLLVAIAVIIGVNISTQRFEKFGINNKLAADLMMWPLVSGFAIAHIYSIVFYYPETLSENPWTLLQFWNGLSSFGGFLGAIMGFAWIAYRNRRENIWVYLDCFLYGFAFAWIFGRMACSLAHDHPGLRSDFWLAIRYPEGARHDLGFYEMLWAIGMSIIFYLGRNKRHFSGFYVATFVICYMPLRFMFDFLRIEDKRYLTALNWGQSGGLTAGQIAAVFLFLAGIAVWFWRRSVGHFQPEAPQKAPAQSA